MGVQRNEDVTCIYIFMNTHQLYNLHARLYIALYQFHPTAACKTSLDLITCWRIFAALNGKYIIKKKSLAMAQATIRSANYKTWGETHLCQAHLPRMHPKTSWLQVEI